MLGARSWRTRWEKRIGRLCVSISTAASSWYSYMDFTRQSPRAASAHEKFLVSGEKTCIDCHKGIAHELPDMTGVPGWQ